MTATRLSAPVYWNMFKKTAELKKNKEGFYEFALTPGELMRNVIRMPFRSESTL